MNKITVTAKTFDIAVANAAKELGVSQEQMDYKLISQTGGGILSFLGGGKKVEIEAWLKGRPAKSSRRKNDNRRTDRKEGRPAPRAKKARAADFSELDETPFTDAEKDALIEELKTFSAGIFGYIVGEEVSVSAKLEEDRLIINADNEYLGQQLSKNRKLAESLEHILRKKPRHLQRRLPFRIFVDVDGSRKSREEELISMAEEMSAKVTEEQKPVVLNYRSAYDRKVIHMALDQDDKVYTKSIGSGTNRKLMILPSKELEASE
jgi:spoIIIJ-associated protein